jgi:hypothetical protein
MRNITVKISGDTGRDAHVWAARRDTSISAIMQVLLQTLPNLRAARAISESKQSVESTHSARVTPPFS